MTAKQMEITEFEPKQTKCESCTTTGLHKGFQLRASIYIHYLCEECQNMYLEGELAKYLARSDLHLEEVSKKARAMLDSRPRSNFQNVVIHHDNEDYENPSFCPWLAYHRKKNTFRCRLDGAGVYIRKCVSPKYFKCELLESIENPIIVKPKSQESEKDDTS